MGSITTARQQGRTRDGDHSVEQFELGRCFSDMDTETQAVLGIYRQNDTTKPIITPIGPVETDSWKGAKEGWALPIQEPCDEPLTPALGDSDWAWQESIVNAVIGDQPPSFLPPAPQPQGPSRQHSPTEWLHPHGRGADSRVLCDNNVVTLSPSMESCHANRANKPVTSDMTTGGRALWGCRGWHQATKEANGPIRPAPGEKLKIDPEPLDDHRLNQRQKQIDYGKNTIGYERYQQSIIASGHRDPSGPVTPDKYAIVSKRTFDTMVRTWRRALHKWDPEGISTVIDAQDDEQGSVTLERLEDLLTP
eukprot:Ihof_evm7s113 gene=Ihof_evmTU7s113